MGRTFGTELDQKPHANPVAVISYGYWWSRYAQDPSIIGRKVRINRTPFEIIGVGQPGYAGETVGFATDIWTPLSMQNEVFPAWTDFLERAKDPLNKIESLQLIGRLKPGLSRTQAEAGINLTAHQIREGEAAGLGADRRRE